MISKISKKFKFVEKEPHEKGFSQYFEENLREKFENLEEERKRLYRLRFWMIPLIILVLGIGITSGIYIITEDSSENFGEIIIMFTLAIAGMIWMHPSSKYKQLMRLNYLEDVLKFFPNTEYYPERGISFDLLKGFRLLPFFNKFETQDYVETYYKGVPIYMCKAVATRGSGKNKLIMRSKLVAVEVSKNFQHDTFVLLDRNDSGLKRKIFSPTRDIPVVKLKELKRVKLEDKRFEKIFDVHSEDQVEARYLLTTAFMERLLKLSESYKANGVRCSFHNGWLLFYLKTKEKLFEAGPLGESVFNFEDIRRFLRQMNEIHMIVETLKLDKETGL